MSESLMDQYGYYQMGDFKTYSVYELMDQYHKDPQPYQWIYNDDFFSQYDWTQEPTESLDELYKQRALELREQYDYLVLFYSGGYDSANMLHAFLDNGIKIDEICRIDSKYDTTSHRYLEGKWKTWKQLDELEKRYPKIKIRRFDNGDLVLNWPKIIKDTNEYLKSTRDPVYYWGPRSSVHRLTNDVMYEYIDDWKKLLKDKKTIGTVWAVDYVQPVFDTVTKNFVHQYSDMNVCAELSPIRQMTNKPDRDVFEFFYWSPTDAGAKIMIKQGHIAKKHYNKLTGGYMLSAIKNKDLTMLERHYPNQLDIRFLVYKDEEFKKLIYPNIFTKGEEFYKPRNIDLWGNVDQWYYNSELPNSQEHWKNICLFIEKDHWKLFFKRNTFANGHKKIKSKKYII